MTCSAEDKGFRYRPAWYSRDVAQAGIGRRFGTKVKARAGTDDARGRDGQAWDGTRYSAATVPLPGAAPQTRVSRKEVPANCQRRGNRAAAAAARMRRAPVNSPNLPCSHSCPTPHASRVKSNVISHAPPAVIPKKR